MKKSIKMLILIAGFGLILSCSKDESLDPRPVLVNGQFVKFDIINKVFDSEDLVNSTFGGVLTAPGNKVVRYRMYVRLFDGVNPATDFKLLKEVTLLHDISELLLCINKLLFNAGIAVLLVCSIIPALFLSKLFSCKRNFS